MGRGAKGWQGVGRPGVRGDVSGGGAKVIGQCQPTSQDQPLPLE